MSPYGATYEELEDVSLLRSQLWRTTECVSIAKKLWRIIKSQYVTYTYFLEEVSVISQNTTRNAGTLYDQSAPLVQHGWNFYVHSATRARARAHPQPYLQWKRLYKLAMDSIIAKYSSALMGMLMCASPPVPSWTRVSYNVETWCILNAASLRHVTQLLPVTAAPSRPCRGCCTPYNGLHCVDVDQTSTLATPQKVTEITINLKKSLKNISVYTSSYSSPSSTNRSAVCGSPSNKISLFTIARQGTPVVRFSIN